ncbi:MAG: PAS domain S-box protein [Alphaproteobacteria bacterium]|nr:PAS domain S-box protein [Alphaproteobacteria bacterium]
MNEEEIFRDLVILSLLFEIIMIGIIIYMQVLLYKYKCKIYFIKRDRERCHELLFSAKDGYFCFVYPDQKVKDPQKGIVEKCSRRLSVMLGLKNGTASSFDEIADSFTKEDARILKKYVVMLKQEGLAFEDILALKGKHRYVCVYGNRVNGRDNNLYCDTVWFREVTAEAARLADLENEKQSIKHSLKQYENMVDGLNYPLWLRDENLNLLVVNKKYLEYSGLSSKDEVLRKNVELSNGKGEAVAKKIAQEAQKTKKIQKMTFNMAHKGELYNYEVQETPYFVGDILDKIGTVGYLNDITELEKAKRNFRINQNNHLGILSALGTAIAIYDSKMKLFFSNTSFRYLWNLEAEFLEKTPTYLQFLDNVREHKMLPPVPDFKAYKEDEMSIFDNLLEPKEDLLHLSDGRTIRRLRAPHPNGVIFAYEDVSDRLATMRRLNELTSMQQNILDNLTDSVVIFGANQRLKFYNKAYLKLWSIDFVKLQDEPKLEEIIAYQKLFFSNIEDWDTFRQSMIANITEGRKFNLSRDDNVKIDVSPQIFYDGSIMITYTIK